jgi:hypothetical protein
MGAAVVIMHLQALLSINISKGSFGTFSFYLVGTPRAVQRSAAAAQQHSSHCHSLACVFSLPPTSLSWLPNTASQLPAVHTHTQTHTYSYPDFVGTYRFTTHSLARTSTRIHTYVLGYLGESASVDISALPCRAQPCYGICNRTALWYGLGSVRKIR